MLQRFSMAAFGAWLGIAVPDTADAAPHVQWLRATPSTVATGAATTLRWHVDGAERISISPGIGDVAPTGTVQVTPTETTTYTITAFDGPQVSSSEQVVVVGPHGNTAGGRFVHMVSPLGGQRFTAPATLRVFAAAYDPTGDGGNRRNAARVDFYVDDQLKAQVSSVQSEYWIFKTRVNDIGVGRHRVWARAIYTNPPATLDSESMWIDVEAAPAYARTISLDQDVVLSGTQDYLLEGSLDGRIRLNGNGHRIRSDSSWRGRLRLTHVDVFGLGPADSPTPAIDVDVTSLVHVENSRFDTSGTVALDFSGSATAMIVGNEFRSNMAMPAAQQPEFEPDASYPALRIRGVSSFPKTFQNNRIGIGWADFGNTSNWLIGGGMGEGNVVMGPRSGIWVRNSSRCVVRGNVIYHQYYGGWSQGNVVELDGSSDVVVEHNVIGGGSWPVRGLSGLLRYNLILDAGHEWLWMTGSGATAHHNVFAGGDGDVAPIRVIYQPQGVRFYNNTLDGLGSSTFVTPIVIGAGATASVRSNAIVGMRSSPGVRIEGTLDADYNLFQGQQGTPRNYSDNRHPAHDVGALNAQVQPRLLEASEPFRYRWDDIWTRSKDAQQILANYRTRYTPAADSPLIDAGDPGTAVPGQIFRGGFEPSESPSGSGNDIGAVGSGIDATDDLFGR